MVSLKHISQPADKQWVPGVKRTKHESDNSPTFSAKVKNDRIPAHLLPLYAFRLSTRIT